MAGIVVVGAGQAGATLVEKLRSGGYEGALTLIGEEKHPPYQRPPLSKKYLLGEIDVSRLYLRPLSFYSDSDISLRTDVQVTKIDRAAKVLALSDGTDLSYEKLALTTGSTPHKLPASIGRDLRNVFTVRTLHDVDAMAEKFSSGAKVLIVGGGYIGLEAAAVAALRGLDVTLVEMADRILQRVASAETSNFFRDLHKSHGVDIREGVGLTKLTGSNGEVDSAELTNGNSLDVDFVIVGVGIAPNISLAKTAGLNIDNGIAVDGAGLTSDPSIFAAGDCTSFPYKGDRIRLESVPNAIDQAGIVASSMLGEAVSYTARPWFWSDQYDMKLQIAGLNTGYDHVVARAGSREGTQSIWYFKGSELVAVDAMNDPRAYMIGKRWIEAGVSPNKGALADPSSDLKTLPVT